MWFERNIFFLGIGGIGMSALARYFSRHGNPVAGYDRTPSALTRELEAEGIRVIYDDNVDAMRQHIGDWNAQNTLVVRTPAVPEDSTLYTYMREQGFDIRKRAEVLGIVTRQKKALCVAGTHGKTTTSTMIAHLMAGDRTVGESRDGVNAFLGGISLNYHTNVLIDPSSDYVVVEADEYDRSFHQLTPYISVVTAVDADHLDIYGTPEAYREAFARYTSLITGALVMKEGIDLQPRLQPGVGCYTYGTMDNGQWTMDNGQWTKDDGQWTKDKRPDGYADNIRVAEGQICFDYHLDIPTGKTTIPDIRLGVPVWVNIENAVAAITVALLSGVPAERIKERMATFGGVWRRFNMHVCTPRVAYIDDYAHHPEEIATAIASVRKLFPDRRLIGVFQPHLYTRTRDFAEGFRQVLATMDECLLLPIYPARELPIPGVSSEMLLSTKDEGGRMKVVEKSDLIAALKRLAAESPQPSVILTVGAGDIDRLVPQVAQAIGDLKI